MIDPVQFCDALTESGVTFYTGVPDSLLKAFCACVTDRVPAERHVVAANEGAAIGLAAGHYLATGRPALVYLQNSGLGNTVNPLLSLAAPEVYGIPMLLVIGWRGEPGVKDEPQHIKQGALTPALCETLDVPHHILPAETDAAVAVLRQAVEYALAKRSPVALLVRAGSFADYSLPAAPSSYALSREDAVAAVAAALPLNAALVATTGHISRELFEHRARQGEGHGRDFLTVGSMGHASQITLGIALAQPTRPVACLDGDGAALMHMGGLGIVGTSRAGNLLHVVLNNGAHDSVGGQPTAGFLVDFVQVAKACGYATAQRVDSLDAIRAALGVIDWQAGPHFLEVRVARGARKDLGRPTRTPVENKQDLMAFLQSNDDTTST